MKHTRIILLIACLGAAAVGLSSLRGATITVTEVGDSDSFPGTLRKALADANDGDTIEFDPSLGGRDLPLAAVFGELVVNKSVTIRWVPVVGYPTYLGVDANHVSRVFYISPGKTVTISGLTIRNGSVPDVFGGGILNDRATLTLNNCTISGNAAGWGYGGGICNDHGTLTMSNCTISGNSAQIGGGIYNNGAYVNATLIVIGSTISGNSAHQGGGIYNEGYNARATLTVIDSTFSGNSVDFHGIGGGILNAAVSDFGDGTAPMTIGNTILNAGSSGENIYNWNGTVTSLGYNLSSDTGGGYLTATGDRINTDPKLGPLQNNGGSVFTHLPASDSPAINAGNPTLGMDQRGAGFLRVVNGRSDIGAVEVQSTPAPTPTPRPHGRR